jgi:hypothetical protein
MFLSHTKYTFTFEAYANGTPAPTVVEKDRSPYVPTVVKKEKRGVTRKNVESHDPDLSFFIGG